MSIFRKDGEKKNSDTKIIGKDFLNGQDQKALFDADAKLDVEPRKMVSNADEDSGEFTDISEISAAFSSSEKAEKPAKMEEIYSTAAKRVRLKNTTPIEAEAAMKRQKEVKENLAKGEMEFTLEEAEVPEVTLEAELEEGTVVADEIIEDVRVKHLGRLYVQDIEGIDISLDPADSLKEYEKQAGNTARHDARHGISHQAEKPPEAADVVVSRVPVYHPESAFSKIFLKAGRFTDVVEGEYDEYLKSTDPTISKSYHAMMKEVKPRQSLLFTLSQMAAKRKEQQEEKRRQEFQQERENFDENIERPKKKKSKVGKFFHVLFMVLKDSFRGKDEKTGEEPLDYRTREDETYVFNQTKANIRRLLFDVLWLVLITGGLLALSVIERTQKEAVFSSVFQNGALMYCLFNLILLLILGLVSRNAIQSGLRPLRHFRGNCDTAVTLAYLACVIQAGFSVFMPLSFAGGDNHLYGFIVSFAFLLNTLGRLLMALRVKSNFNFITSRSPAYAAKIFSDEETARRMVSGTTANKGVIAYQHITSFLSDFLKISYAPDPSEEAAGKVTPVTIVSTLFVTVAYGFIFKDAAGTASALSVMLCISIPFSALLLGNIPMLIFSKRMLTHNAMVAGYPSVRQFCDTSAVMVTADELFPKGCVKLEGIKPFVQYRVDDGLLLAAVVLGEIKSPMVHVFDDLLEENAHLLPKVESVMYEEKSGVVGWVNGERVLIGNMALMNRYHITVPEDSNEVKYRARGLRTAYIAVSGQLVAMAALTYHADQKLVPHLRRAEKNGVAFVVSTTDANITAELVAEEYGIFFRSVKIMSAGYAGVVDEVTSKVEETSRAYLATRGRFSSLCRAISGCIGLRSNLTIGVVIEIFALVLGVLLCATLVLYASVARLSVVELMMYILFWGAASVIAALIRRP